MKMNNIKKIGAILFLVIIAINVMTVNSRAAFSIRNAIDNAKSFPGTGTANEIISTGDLREAQGTVYSILMAVGVIVAVIGITIIGVRFMMSAPEGRAEIKERMIPFVVGAIVVFGALGIWRMMVNLVQSIAQ